uniref:NADH-ubiquinone oxidoreductase chain 4L n=1 Tax=Molipteryx lunata TaxID=2575659 RepID=A0A4D6X829_9HEMI|nr:NADH dehydrogenase subunit 4L [Molipteryx lunata]YP_010995005.1 NADH dehydrogenase subunit 4L [Molipteryx fuliginosa]QCI09335.1 NADH dehydrogenase subunit 4L [Molipteryx lunata]WOZ14013.1 NADH dehydrogenase subunit 4L [Molipteryx fuliginosa]
MNLINLSINFMFFVGVVGFSFTRKHLLMTLFSLEYLILVLFLLLFFYLLSIGFEMYIILVFLTFTVCEGALGLGVLVNMIRSHGNDLLSSLSILSW